MAQTAVLAIDEGTTNAKAVLVSESGKIIASGSAPVSTSHPQSGWVQQDADEIWRATQRAIEQCTHSAPNTKIVALGISNQRESILIWDRKTGEALGPVITWQCRRTADACEALKAAGHEQDIIARTGLPIDPLFPPTKVAWLLKNHGQRTADICIGTVDSWLLWKLSDGAIHATDRSNAARTQLFNLVSGCWDPSLCELFGVDSTMLPTVYDSSYRFGTTMNTGVLPDGIPLASAIGDSHAALFGHGAFGQGDGKITFGTGCSVMTTVAEFISPPSGITTTIAWSLDGKSTFALEGNILTSASLFPWAAEMLGLSGVDELLALAQTVPDSAGVSLVPAHVGLGAPHWNSSARGLISGLSFGSSPAHVARAAADSTALQAQEVFAIMAAATGGVGRLFVDGGPSRNRFLMQLVSDYLDHPVTPCTNSEASALGAAHLAGLTTGFWSSTDAIAQLAQHDAELSPRVTVNFRDKQLSIWKNAIARAIL